MHPGSTQAFGRLGPDGVPTFLFPSNPATALLLFEVLVRPLIRLALGPHRPAPPHDHRPAHLAGHLGRRAGAATCAGGCCASRPPATTSCSRSAPPAPTCCRRCRRELPDRAARGRHRGHRRTSRCPSRSCRAQRDVERWRTRTPSATRRPASRLARDAGRAAGARGRGRRCGRCGCATARAWSAIRIRDQRHLAPWEPTHAGRLGAAATRPASGRAGGCSCARPGGGAPRCRSRSRWTASSSGT